MGNADLQNLAQEQQKAWFFDQYKPSEPDLFASGDVVSDAHAGDLKTDDSANLPRKAGRPKGSINKDTAELAKHLEKANGKSPLQFMYETFGKKTVQVAAELNCSPLEARKVQTQCAIAAAPFAHRKQPIDIDVKGGMMNIYLGDVPAQGDVDDVEAVPFVQLGASEWREVEAEKND